MDKKNKIVLLSGLLGDAEFWKFQVETLNDIGEVIIPEYSNYPTLKEAAKQLLTDLPEHFSIVGFSLGGNLALELYQQAKDKVNSIVLISTGALPVEDEVKARLTAEFEQITGHDVGFRKFVENCGERFFYKNEQREFLTEFVNAGVSQGQQKCLNQINMLLEKGAQSYSINCPGLILYGENDFHLPLDRIKKVAKFFKEKEVHCIPKAEHFLTWDNSQAINGLLESWFKNSNLK